HDETTEAEQRRAAITFGLDALLESDERILREPGAEPADRGGEELRLQLVAEKLRERFPALQADVTRKTIAHDHVDVVQEHLKTLDRSDIIDQRTQLLEGFVRAVGERVALALLGADREQADTRLLDAEGASAV